jgi:hypothetical protein
METQIEITAPRKLAWYISKRLLHIDSSFSPLFEAFFCCKYMVSGEEQL